MMDDRGAFAAIDCGTNSTRLLIEGDDGRVLERIMRITRLGQSVDATHELAPDAIERTVVVLSEYRQLMDLHGVIAARMATTSATRDAVNAAEFFTAARDATGLEPELLSGEEEGRLSFAGATAHLPSRWRDGGRLLVVDIGGGSTELVAGEPSAGDSPQVRGPLRDGGGEEATTVSLDIGCVRLTERFFHHDPPSSDELGEARTFVRTQLGHARDPLPSLAPRGLVVGLAGTVSTLGALEVGAADYERSLIHHTLLSRRQVRGWLKTLAGEPSSERADRKGMASGREDVIVGGVLILDSVMEVFDRELCLVSEDDILDGLVASVRTRVATR
jgi:exopolyphosphatase / guanosine-5'-triphosphate,3'-diphosphate pyrophosphatase